MGKIYLMPRPRTAPDGLCTKCLKPLDGAHKSYCKACFAEYKNEHRAKNKDRYNEVQKAWRAEHPEYVVEKNHQRWLDDPEKWEAYYRKWRLEHPESRLSTRQKSHLKEYGLTPEDKERMLAEQDGKCPICRRVLSLYGRGRDAAFVDHDHVTDEVRSLLCLGCNTGIGMFDEDPDRMVAAAAYLRVFAAQRSPEDDSPQGQQEVI